MAVWGYSPVPLLVTQGVGRVVKPMRSQGLARCPLSWACWLFRRGGLSGNSRHRPSPFGARRFRSLCSLCPQGRRRSRRQPSPVLFRHGGLSGWCCVAAVGACRINAPDTSDSSGRTARLPAVALGARARTLAAPLLPSLRAKALRSPTHHPEMCKSDPNATWSPLKIHKSP